MDDSAAFLCRIDASKVSCSSPSLAVTSAFICRCLEKSSGKGYLFAPKPSQIFKILALVRSPAKNTTYTVFSTISPLAGSCILPSMAECFRYMFPRVARKRIRSNPGVFCVGRTPQMNPRRTLSGSWRIS